MAYKIIMIGGGSYVWTPTLVNDLFLREGLRGSELVLVDIAPEPLDHLTAYCRMLNDELESGWSISSADLDKALPGADVVCVSISVGGLETFALDYRIPEAFGIYHTTGDTVGPGGISRTLRNVPVFLEIARKMEALCPGARMIHVTNPLAQITRAVCRASSVECVGLCHNYHGTRGFLADFLDVEPEAIEAVSVGINHGTWLKEITCKGRPVGAERLTVEAYRAYVERKISEKSKLETNTTDDILEIGDAWQKAYPYQMNFELFQILGTFPVGHPAHLSENLPYFLNDLEVMERHQIGRKGVLPRREKVREKQRERIVRMVEGSDPLEKKKLSHETFSVIVEALATGRPGRSIVNVPNRGQVSDLPRDVIVETWAEIASGTIRPVLSGPMPRGTLGWTTQIVEEEELAVEAALTGDRKVLEQALLISPLVQNKDCATELAAKLLEAHREYLPQFFQ
jgi:alpha-galactosidase/6-phospho-beta-glucosidase family protein